MYSQRLRGVPHVTFSFYVRRFFRIYPLAICCILVALLFKIPSMTWRPTEPLTRAVVIANLLLIQNIFTKRDVIGPLWSLPYEVQMYLVLPFLYTLTTRVQAIGKILLLIAGFCAAGVLLFKLSGHLNQLAYVPCFLAGVLTFALRDRIKPRFSATLWPPFLIAIIALYCFVHLGAREPIYWVGWLFTFILCVSINLFTQSECRWFNSISHLLAQYSYGIYLWHVPFLYLVFVAMAVRNIPVGIFLAFHQP